MVPVLLRLKELARHDGTWEGLRSNGKTPALVFSPEIEITRLLPTWAPQGSLLEMGSSSFQSLSQSKRKQLLYTHLYYSGTTLEYLRDLISDRTDNLFMAYYAKASMFGPERVLPFLGRDFKPITPVEIEREVGEYGAFADSFSRDQVLKRPITYAITSADMRFDFSRIDEWYERDIGEKVGDYNLYRLKLRN